MYRCIILFLISGMGILAGCDSLRPENRYGPVIDESRILTAALFIRATRGDVIPPDTLFVKQFRYVTRPASWSVTASGHNSPITLFEQTGVYVKNPFGMTLLSRLPYKTDGLYRPSVRIAVREAGPLYPGLETKPRFIVYGEGEGVYGGINIDTELLSGSTPVRDLDLLVDSRVKRAALASDGMSIVYIDDRDDLYILPAGATAPQHLASIPETLGPVTVRGVRWDTARFDRVFVLIQGNFGDQVYAMFTTATALSPSGSPPGAVSNDPPAGLVEMVENSTRFIDYDVWKMPAPSFFER